MTQGSYIKNFDWIIIKIKIILAFIFISSFIIIIAFISTVVHSCSTPNAGLGDRRVREWDLQWTTREVWRLSLAAECCREELLTSTDPAEVTYRVQVEGATLTQPITRLGNILETYCKNTEDISLLEAENPRIACDSNQARLVTILLPACYSPQDRKFLDVVGHNCFLVYPDQTKT